jgi:hypothetical protein
MNVADRVRRWVVGSGALPLVWIALTIVALVPVWSQRLLPMLDTPNHLALVRGWHSFHDPAYKIADYYTLRIRPVPYFLFYLAIHLLLYLCSIEVANKIFLSAYLILFPLSVLVLARALRRSPWLALAAFPLAFNQNWIYGFSSYLMGTCFMFLAFAWLIRWLDGGPRWTLRALGVSCITAYFSHVMPWFCFGLCAIALLLLYLREWRRGLWAALAMAPSLGLAIAAYVEERHAHSYFRSGEGLGALGGTWRDFPTLVAEFPRRIMELFPGNVDLYVLITIALTVIGLAFWRGTHHKDESPVERRRLSMILAVLAFAYCMLPYRINQPMSWWYVSPRLPSMMAPILVLLPVAQFDGWRKVLMVPVMVCAIVLPLTLTRLYHDFSRRNMPFMRLVEKTPLGSRVMVVVRNMMMGPGGEELSGDPATSGPVYWHFSSWPMALHGGYDPYIFDQGIPIQPRIRLRAPAWSNTDSFAPRQAPDFDYYLVRGGKDDPMGREPSLKVIGREDAWTLYQRIHTMTDEP